MGDRRNISKSVRAALALLAAALFLQGCAPGYYACRQQGFGRDACDGISRGRG